MPKFKPKTGKSTPWTEEWTPTEITGHLNGNGDLVDLEFRAVKNNIRRTEKDSCSRCANSMLDKRSSREDWV